MLDDVKKLNETVTEDQLAVIQELLSTPQFKALQSALSAATEKQATGRVTKLRKVMDGVTPVTLFKISMILDKEQRDAISEIMDL